MKKCPKCGTILDDSKKKCYMCGADLQRTTVTNFGDSFDEQIGATVTKSQDNVFNNVQNISAKVNDVISNSTSNATFSQNSSSSGIYNNQINGLNSLHYDERTALEKIFTGDARFRSKDEINANEAMKQNEKNIPNMGGNFNPTNGNLNNDVNPNFSNNVMPNNVVNNGPNFSPSEVKKEVKHKDGGFFNKKEKKEKPQINWGNNLSGSNSDTSSYKDKVSKKFNLNISFIVNTLCFLLFLVGMGYLYFHYIKPEDDKIINLGGLNYSIDKEFLLKSDDTYSKYYTHGENCAVKVTYAPTNDVDGFVDSYFETVKESYANNENYSNVVEDIKINDNLWHALSIIEFQDNAAATGGYSKVTKYKYVSMVYKGNFYNIVYANTDNESTCSAMYDKFINTLAFD